MQPSAEPPQEPAQASQFQTHSVSPPPPRWNSVVWRTFRLLLLAVTVTALWCITYDRWGSDFSVPTRYNFVDTDFHLAMIKIAQEGDWPLVGEVNSASLGAPFTGNQNDFPINNRTYWLAGYFARIFGLFPAANMMMIGFHLLAAFSFYFAARLWRISRLYAWAFSIIYSTLPQFAISVGYFGVLSFGLLPLQIYTCWYIAIPHKISWRSPSFKLALITGVLSGALNIYWVLLFLQLYLLALFYRACRKSSHLLKATIPICLTLLTLKLCSSGHFLYNYQHEENASAVIREYQDIEKFALVPFELFLPRGGEAFNLTRSLNKKYHNLTSLIHIESDFSYIGICAILGIAWLLINSFVRQLKGKSLPLALLAIIWIIACFALGGINSLFSLAFDFYKIRGTTRYAIAIGTIGLLYFALTSDRMGRNWKLWYRFVLISFVGLIGLGDHLVRPFIHSRKLFAKEDLSSMIKSDRDLVVKLENGLPNRSMIFMLPVMPFPEYGWKMNNMADYEPFRPFLHSTRLHYSFGSNKGRQGADWQLDVQELPAGEMATALESYGFAGILLNRKGYKDRGEQLLSELAEAGWPMEFEQGIDNEWVFIRLSPAEEPVLPTLTPYAVTTAK